MNKNLCVNAAVYFVRISGVFWCLKIRFRLETETSAFRKVWMIWKEQISVKIFTGRKKALAGCLAAVIVLAGGFNVWQSSQVPEFPNFTDPVVETTITEDDTPLASKPKVTTKTTSNTKTTRKKMLSWKKRRTKTYTKKLPTTNKKSTTTKKTNRNTTVKTLKTVKTATTQKYTKKSKTAVQTRKVTTTIQTTTTVMAASATAGKANAASTKKVESISMDSKYSVSNIASIAPKMDSRVLKAYKKLGFTVTIDPSVNYGGCFNAHSRSIILRFWEWDNLPWAGTFPCILLRET